MTVVFILCLIIVALAVAICYVLDVLTLACVRCGGTTITIDAVYFTQCYGVEIPLALQRIFDPKFLPQLPFTIKNQESEQQIHTLVPPTVEAIDESQEVLGEGRYGFARDDFDNLFFIEVGKTASVFFMDAETGDVTDMACTLDDLFSVK